MNTIVSDVLGDTKYIIQPVESFGNSVSIVATEITEEQKNKIVEKFNEKYKTELKSDNINIENIPFTRVKDVVKPFIVPGIISLLIVIVYFLIRFRKLEWKKILLKTILVPAFAELVVFSIMALVRAPFGRVAISIGTGTYVACIFALTCIFEKQRKTLLEELENKDKTV